MFTQRDFFVTCQVQGHLIQECTLGSQFEVTGSMQEVTSMLIDKVMGDRREALLMSMPDDI